MRWVKAHLTKCKHAASLLKAWREREGLSVTAAAVRLEVNMQSWWQWEHVRKRPSIVRAMQLDVLTQGAVPFERWDYDGRIVVTMAHIAAQRAKARTWVTQ